MKILLTWGSRKDMESEGKPDHFGGPTLELLRNRKFDQVFLFTNDNISKKKANLLVKHVNENPTHFNYVKVVVEHVELTNPASYSEIWESFPGVVEKIIKRYEKSRVIYYIGISAGTPAMSATWVMMVGSGQIKATLLNAQLINGRFYIQDELTGLYPYIEKIQQEVDRKVEALKTFKSTEMKRILSDLIILAERTDRPVLLLGETGTGKTFLARQYHQWSGRKHFQEFACGALKGADLNIAKSELFGVEKGFLPEYRNPKTGALEEANGGTLFLDEIGDIPFDIQRMLIRAIEEKSFRKLGSSETINSDFKLICATNRNLKEMVELGEMHEDFYYRISMAPYIIPPLRERPEDIPILIEELLKEKNLSKLKLEKAARFELVNRLQKAYLRDNIRGVIRTLDSLFLMMLREKKPRLVIEDIENHFQQYPEPTSDDEFDTLVERLFKLFPGTAMADLGYKWKDAVIDAALKRLILDKSYRKKTGDLNIKQIATNIGIDNKTVIKKIGEFDLRLPGDS